MADSPGGFPAHAVIVIGSAIVPDDLAAIYHRVGGRPAHPTCLCPLYGLANYHRVGGRPAHPTSNANDYFRYFSNHSIVRRR